MRRRTKSHIAGWLSRSCKNGLRSSKLIERRENLVLDFNASRGYCKIGGQRPREIVRVPATPLVPPFVFTWYRVLACIVVLAASHPKERLIGSIFTHIKISNSRYRQRYLGPRRYALRGSSGDLCRNSWPASRETDGESRREGSNTRRLDGPCFCFSNPTIVNECPVNLCQSR